MSISKNCKNCAIDGHCLEQEIRTDKTSCCTNGHFIPKEELVRQDEKEKIITDLEYEIQNFNEVRDSKTIEFIYSFIKELKEK